MSALRGMFLEFLDLILFDGFLALGEGGYIGNQQANNL
jgi:hypothetical protein